LSAGKVRALTIFDERNDLLGPLHKMIYNHLSSFDWLLVGPPTEGRITSSCRLQVQTSVDLVAATDNLSLSVAGTILDCLLARASRVPGEIKTLASNALPCLVEMGKEVIQVSHGQMMGSYLSFPLLCLQSYIAARWATRGVEAVILVNGDDTLISSNSPVSAGCYPPGFILNEAKTIRSQVVAEINSTCFLKDGRGRWRQVHHLRRGSFLTNFSGLQHAAAAVRSRVEWTDAFVRSRVGKRWGLSPAQLRLHPRSYPGFCRNREIHRKRSYTDLPARPSGVDESLVALRGEPAEDERICLAIHLRNVGRFRAEDKGAFNPSIGWVRRSFSYLKREPRSMLTFLGKLAALRRPTVEKTRRYYVPEWYQPRSVDEGIRKLDPWKQAVRDLSDAY